LSLVFVGPVAALLPVFYFLWVAFASEPSAGGLAQKGIGL
jgi:tryptophan-rich sensory protein